jgi:hypothetical protein
MNNNNKFVDSCRLLGIYNNIDVYLYSSAKYYRPRLFYISNYFYLPKWIDGVKEFNKTKKYKNWVVPRKGTYSYKAVMEMIKPVTIKPMSTKIMA